MHSLQTAYYEERFAETQTVPILCTPTRRSGLFGSEMTEQHLNAVWRTMRATALVVSSLSFLITAASADQQSDIKRAVNEIIAACQIGPTNSLKEALGSKLEKFLQQSIETKSAKSDNLTTIFAQLPTDNDEALGQLPDLRARQAFFAIYFNCIRHQVNLMTKSLGIALE
jgi:hypothetical protein